MMRFTRCSFLLVFLTVAGLQTYPTLNTPALAQTPACSPDHSIDNREFNLRDQARSAIETGEIATAARYLQEALVLTPQTQYPHNAVEQWLLEDNNGTRFARLMQSIDQKQSTQLLNQLFQITQRLSPNYSAIKTRAFAAIAQHYIALNQRPTALSALNQARDSIRFVKGTTERADSLLDIAAGYAALPQPRIAQSALIQAEKAVQQVRQSDRLARLARLAEYYAQDDDFPKARAIAAQIPKNSELQSVALRKIVETHLASKNLNDADRVSQAISHPAQKAITLGKIAVAYDLAKQPNQATQRFQQAVQIAKTPNLTSAFLTAENVFRELVTNYLQTGRRDEARKLAQTNLSFLKKEAFKAILLADVQAKQPEKAKQLLTQQLIEVQNQQDSWQRSELAALIKTATEAQLFDWIAEEWQRISKIDYGLDDTQVERIVKAYAQNGQQVQALQWAEKLPIANRPLLQLRLKSAIALVAHQSGQTAWARNLLQSTEQQIDSMIKAAREQLQREGGDTNAPDDIEYIGNGLIALSYSQMGDAATTKRLLDRVIQSKSNQEDLQLGGRIDNPFEMFKEAKQLMGSLQLAIGSPMPEKRQQRLGEVASMALAQNRFDLATSIVPQLTSEAGQTQLLLAIAQRYAELKQNDKALPFLAQAFKVAQTIPGDESQFDRLGADGGTVIEMDNDRGSLIEAIAIQYARLKQPTQALKVANTLKEKQTRDQALEKVRCAIANPS